MALGLVAGGGLALLLGWSVDGLHPREAWLGWQVVGLALVAGAGILDDLQPDRTSGIVAQLRELRAGRVTTGVVKLVVIVLAALLVTSRIGGAGWRPWVGAAVVAGTANVWNLLDVRPGRALKAFLPAGLLLAFLTRAPEPAFLLAAFLLAAFLLRPDLQERGMLGDCGANVLGFVVGVGLYQILSTPGLVVTLVVLLALHVVSETVTLSHVIQATPPLRWADRLGRTGEEPRAAGKSGR